MKLIPCRTSVDWRRLPLAGLVVVLLPATWLTAEATAAPDDIIQGFEVEAPVIHRAPVHLNDSNFEQWVFTGAGKENVARQRMMSRLNLQIDELERACQLTPDQKNKLVLAARGDLKDFFDDVAVVYQKFQQVRQQPNAFQLIWPDIQPLQLRQAVGLFGDDSIFAKTMKLALDEQQIAKYRQVIDERRRYRYRANIEVALATLSDQVPLSKAQHEALVKLLVQETPLPAGFGQFDQFVVLYQFSKLPQEKVKPLFSNRQWAALQPQLAIARNMEATLIQNGLIARQGTAAELPPELEGKIEATPELPVQGP